MNKEALATILGVAGLSLLKKVSGSANDSDLHDSLGNLWYKVTISDEEETGHDLHDFYYILKGFINFSNKYKNHTIIAILGDNDIEVNEMGRLMHPQRALLDLDDLVKTHFDYSQLILESFGYGDGERVMGEHAILTTIKGLLDLGSIFSSTRDIGYNSSADKYEFYVQINIMEALKFKKRHENYLLGLSDKDGLELVSYVLSDKLNDINNLFYSFMESIEEIDEPVDAEVSFSLVTKDKRFSAPLFRNDSELRKF